MQQPGLDNQGLIQNDANQNQYPPNMYNQNQPGVVNPQMGNQQYPQQGMTQPGAPNQQSGLAGGLGGALGGELAGNMITNAAGNLIENAIGEEASKALKTQNEIVTIKIPQAGQPYFQKYLGRKTARQPAVFQCNHCQQNINTEITSSTGMGQIGCAAAFAFLCPLFCWCPFVIDECYDHQHRCPNCKNVVTQEKFLCGN